MDERVADNETSSEERLNVRYIALGAFVIFLTLFGGEKLIWKLVDPSTQTFLSQSLQEVSAPNLSDEKKAAIRGETISRLSRPSILFLAIVVLLAPLGVGVLLGNKSRSLLSAPIAVMIGAGITLAISQAISVGAILACIVFSAISLPGCIISKKIQNRRYFD